MHKASIIIKHKTKGLAGEKLVLGIFAFSAWGCFTALISGMIFVWPSKATRPFAMKIKQSIHRHQTPPRCCNAARCAILRDAKSVLWSYGPLRPNMTSSIKPEVHNVAQPCRRRTKPRTSQRNCTQNFMPIGPAVPEIYSRTDRRTDA